MVMKLRHSKIRSKLRSVLFTLINRIENNNNADFFKNGEEQFINEYFKSITGSVTLLDVGGNIGEYSEILIDQCSKRNIGYSLHIFEPTKSCFETLKNKFGINHNVYLNNTGASDTETTADIYYDAEKSGFASLYNRDLTSINVQMNMKEKITLVRLDDYIAKNNIAHIDFMKIDIEGHEVSAFTGMGKYLNGDFIKAIQFEYGGVNLDSKTTLREIYTLLEGSGFVIGKIMSNGIEIRPYSVQMENYQYANYVALSRKHFPSVQ
jgi:FkbM family methyltransferase